MRLDKNSGSSSPWPLCERRERCQTMYIICVTRRHGGDPFPFHSLRLWGGGESGVVLQENEMAGHWPSCRRFRVAGGTALREGCFCRLKNVCGSFLFLFFYEFACFEFAFCAELLRGGLRNGDTLAYGQFITQRALFINKRAYMRARTRCEPCTES